MISLTKPQQRALNALHQGGGEGAIDKRGRIVISGERTPFLAETWLRLVSFGMIEPRGPNRLRITEAGRRAALPPSLKINPDLVRVGPGTGRVEAAPGAE